MSEFDLIVVGGGPAGYSCAIRASQLKLKVALIEKRPSAGGTCIYEGCIPSKVLLDISKKFSMMRHADEYGIELSSSATPVINVAKMMERKDKVIEELCGGLDFLMKKNSVTVYRGTGTLQSCKPDMIELLISDENKNNITVKGRNCVLATGSKSTRLPRIPIDEKNIVTSATALSFTDVPESLAIIGGGIIGLEIGSIWKRLGTDVTIIEMLPGILMNSDRQIRESLERSLKRQGMKFMFSSKVTGVEVKDEGVCLSITNNKDEAVFLNAKKVLVATGREPCTDSLNLTSVTGVKFDKRGCIEVDPKTFFTGVPNLYAIGDLIDGLMLAHRASEDGVSVAQIIAGTQNEVRHRIIPAALYTWPEAAWFGKGEEELKESGTGYKAGKVLFRSNGRAKAMGEFDGMVKLIADAKTDMILGAFIVGANASELIGELAVAAENNITAERIAASVHAHPTLSEIVREAALDLHGRAVHT